jgi:hypothetical protein
MSTLLQAILNTFPHLLNVLLQIATKLGLKKNYCGFQRVGPEPIKEYTEAGTYK